MLVFSRGVPDLTVYTDLECGAIVVVANPDADLGALVSMAGTLLDSDHRRELLDRLASDPAQLLLAHPPLVVLDWRPG